MVKVPDIRQKILMCAPDHFGVDYVINPWMESNRGKTDRTLAQKQWAGLRDALALYTDLVFVPPQPHLPDLVFTANAGMVLGKTAVVSRFRSPERQGEEPVFRTSFEQNGFTIAKWPKNVFFEGAGDVLLDRGHPVMWCGYVFRSDEAAAGLLEQLYNRGAVSLHLIDARFYHLDTCFCPLEDGYLMYYPPALDPESQAKVTGVVPPEKRIVVGEEDALNFACNAVDLNRYVFLNAATPALQAKLHAAGFKTVITPLSEFLKAGGTAKCLTLKLHEA